MNNDKSIDVTWQFSICLLCHVAVLQPHPELLRWMKCPLCGFSIKDQDAPRPKKERVKLRGEQ